MNDASSKPKRPAEEAMEAAILEITAGASKTIMPEDAARALAGENDWHSLLPMVRRCAIRLAKDGRLVIYRKGKPVDPGDFRGVYRIGMPPKDAA